MKQDYFILEFAHSLQGRMKRIHIPHRFIYSALGVVGVSLLVLMGVASSYARMAWKVSDYNSLQHEAQLLRTRYENLQKKVKQDNEQLASLQSLADEVATAYGVRNQLAGSPDLVAEAPLAPTMGETLSEYNYLRTSNLASRQRNIFVRGDVNVVPGIWPVNGRLMDGFGHRSDPLSGEGEMHKGVDISALQGTPVKAAADGIVVFAAWNGGYGRCVIVDHGNNYKTLYGHLSRITAIEGQEIRQGEVLGAVGTSGHSTGPHLHYEVHIGSTPVNPYRFLRSSPELRAQSGAREFPF
ncbi:MAG TPA: M23 family metallopeptidase [Bryobacteraceae bacterium]|jgi:murein DD-endopeptidase MepM/ murein hydrolase activator NlpD|nr:M23 family metallopeptidase [Bryobacteraceae bacterium]